MPNQPTLTVTKDFTKDFMEIVARYKSDNVVVGIPADEDDRKEGDEIGNAGILAINEFGSPANNIPARPVMRNGIKNAQEAIADEFKQAVGETLEKGLRALPEHFERIGIIASNSIKKAIRDQDFEGGGPDNEGPAESTLKARQYIGSKGFKGTKSLIVTAQMLNAITYVVKTSGGF